MVVRVIITFVLMAVVGATGGGACQLAVEVGGCHRLHRGSRFPGADFNALPREHCEGALADAARDDDVGTFPL